MRIGLLYAQWLQNPENFKAFQEKYRQQDRQNALKRFEETRRKRDEIRQAYRRRIAQLRVDMAVRFALFS